MRISRLPLRAWIGILRFIPRSLHTRSTRAAVRVADLDEGKRRALARNLAAMLRPKHGAPQV